jgi:bifunctional DNA-binding transcriptional regulator/antitoxin component of YhaV-PrlF toxin-antitoxin module
MATVYKRSLLRMGEGGLVVSIPKPWADYYQLKPGDKVIVVANKKLVIRPVGKEERM